MSIIHGKHSHPDDPRLTKIVSLESDSVRSDHPLVDVPKHIGRYEVIKCLAEGGQCLILLGRDPRLDRVVAIKIPRTDRQVDNTLWQEFLHEARSVAKIRHESVISVIDVDRTEDGLPFVVMEYIDGSDLHTYWMKREFDLHQALTIIREVAAGLQFVHEHGIAHRDLKPSNIIIDQQGHARIADFGLALELHSLRHSRNKTQIAGTARFMSPEQLSGETHLIDERTDIWGLGVILYWMCAGEYPFPGGDNFQEQQEQIRRQQHRHLDQCNRKVPKELDRICRRCLCELRQDRYPSAKRFIEDIDALIEYLNVDSKLVARWAQAVDGIIADSQGLSDGGSLENVVPKGLLPYNEADAGFFTALLPGPRDRFGVPECLRYWLSRLVDQVGVCSHGLIYGASGCGKTSFIRAGLIPRLPGAIGVVYFDCSVKATESSLTMEICRKLRVEYHPQLQLNELLRELREGNIPHPFRRILIVLDQFEQFLSSSSEQHSNELVAALRHCDGERLSCLISVQDDFWVATQEFLRLQEIQIQDGRNSQAFPYFDDRHAEKILTRFGQAYGAIPEDLESQQLRDEAQDFSRRVVASISIHGKVNCAHLAMVASVIGSRQWSAEELERTGGWKGVLIRFMDEQFSLETAPIANRRLLSQVQGILQVLLPVPGAHCNSVRKTAHELIKACPNSTSAEAFQNAIHLLERDCHLIKSVDANGGSDHSSDQTLFQLSHHMLAEPLRKWLEYEKRSSWRGRAESELSELSEAWHSRRSRQYFPSLLKLMQMKLAVRNQPIREKESEFLSKAIRYQLARLGATSALLMVIASVTYVVISENRKTGQKTVAYLDYLYSDSGDSLEKLESLDKQSFAPIILDRVAENATELARLRHAAAQITFESGDDKTLSQLLKSFGKVDIEEKTNVVAVLKRNSDLQQVSTAIRSVFESAKTIDEQMKLSLLAFDLGESQYLQQLLTRSSQQAAGNTIQLRHRFWEFSSLSPSDVAERYLAGIEDRETELLLLSVLYLEDGYLKLSPEQSDSLIDSMRAMYVESEDALSHAFAKWILQKNRIELPDVRGVKRSNWECLPQGVTLVSVEGGLVEFVDEYAPPELKEVLDIEITDTQITIGQFREFMNDDDYKGEKPYEVLYQEGRAPMPHPREWQFDPMAYPTNEHPVTRVSAIIGAMYCNWLSEKNGYQKAYTFVENSFKFDPQANGFRLPTVEEVHYITQGGVQGASFLGNQIPTDWVNSYGSFLEFVSRDSRLAYDRSNFPSARRLPNPQGLFDTIGGCSKISVNYLIDVGVITRHSGPACYETGKNVLENDYQSWRANVHSSTRKLGFRVTRGPIALLD